MNHHWIARNQGIANHPLVKKHAARAGVEIVVGRKNRKGQRIGWGYKASGLWAKEQAGFRLFEDGFLRSLRPGYTEGALYSIVEDRTGIYYDGAGISDLVEGLNGKGEIGRKLGDSDWRPKAEQSLRRFTETGASKYNWFENEHHGPGIDEFIPEDGILIVDQTRGDAAIRFGKGTPDAFPRMLRDALEESSGPVYLRTHPDALYRAKASCFDRELLKRHGDRIRIVPAGYAPHQVFPRVSRVFVFSSLLGMEALLHGKNVRVYGCPFYSGWGFTEDCHPERPVRRQERSLVEVFHAAYQLYSHYFDPVTGETCSLNRVLDHLELQKRKHAENREDTLLFGFPQWKSRIVSGFLACPGLKTVATQSPQKAEQWISENGKTGKVISWSVREQNLSGHHFPVRVEDGFLRSVGLGADFHRPLSLVFDSRGMYFDASRSSDLEHILRESRFTKEELDLARKLIGYLVRNRITKYNLRQDCEGAKWPDRKGARILVPGQVENDASLSFGQSPFLSNLDFLRRVREKNPSAVIAFKPHPDVVKRLRPGRPVVEEMNTFCDVVVTDLDINSWLDTCDEVHTLTSQTGFEALLRGKKVTCHGMPFYSGWGLTTDVRKPERRNRKLTLEELVAGTLIRYPTYLHPQTGEFITAGDAAKLLNRNRPAEFSRSRFFRAVAAAKRMIHPLRR